MNQAVLIVQLLSFCLFGWLIYKCLKKQLSAVAVWFVVSIVAIVQMCMAATFEVLEGSLIFSLVLMFVSLAMILITGAFESRKPWADEDRLIKKVHDVLAPFE